VTEDPFREVDEDLRESRRAEAMRRYAPVAIALILAVVALAGGREIWLAAKASRAEADAAQFVQASELAETDPDRAIAQFAALAETGGAGYRALALLRQAAVRLGEDDADGALKAYETLAADAGAPDLLKSVARLQAARLMVETASPDDVRARLGDLTERRTQFRGLALEIAGLASYRAGEEAAAREAFEAIMLDPLAGEQVRTRADAVLGLLGPGPLPAQEAAPPTDAAAVADE